MKNQAAIPWWVVLLCLATLTVGVAGREPWTPDEPRETAITAAMARGGPLLIPRLGGAVFVEKPPFYYWLSALSMRVLSPIASGATAARGVSALCAALTLLLIWAAGRESRGKEFGASALTVLATTFAFFRAGHWIILDPLLMLLIAGAVLLPFLGLSRQRPELFLAGCLCGGLAFLTKGFVAWALLFFPWGLLFFLYRRELLRRPGFLAGGAALLLAPPAIWMVIFRLSAGPALWREWFVVNNLGRFFGQAAHLGHIKGPLYYLWLAPLLLLPWTPALLGGIFRRGQITPKLPEVRNRGLLPLAAAWGLGGLLILSLSSTKREVYFYPLLPAFALLAAATLERLPRWSEIALGVICAIFPPAMLFFAFALPRWTGKNLALQAGFEPVTAGLGAAAVLAFFYLRDRPAARTATVAALFYLAAGRLAPDLLNPVWSYRTMTETLSAAIPPESRDRVAVWGRDETTQGVFFYYAGITLPMLKDRKRVPGILKGNDPEFDLIVVPRREEFQRANPKLPPFRVAAWERRGRRRIFYLLGPRRRPDR